MAKMYGAYSCGHEGYINITGSIKDREWKKKRAFNSLCPECYKNKIENKNKESCAFSSEMNLPHLEGSEGQEIWAETIRMNIFKDIHSIKNIHFMIILIIKKLN